MKSFEFRLLDFIVKDDKREIEDSDSNESDNNSEYQPKELRFGIQVFGLDEKGKTYCAHIENFKPFFFVKIPDNWTKRHIQRLKIWIENKIPNYMRDSVVKAELVERKTLYGFDAGKEYNFACFYFHSQSAMNRAKALWTEEDYNGRRLITGGIEAVGGKNLEIYESNILPLLRFFHIQNISPSGWVRVEHRNCITTNGNHNNDKTTTCDYEFTVEYSKIQSLRDKETNVPYKICSFDIEASSSHGDFPVPIKNYKKLATDILNYWDQPDGEQRDTIDMLGEEEQTKLLSVIIHSAFRNSIPVDESIYEDILEKDEYKNLERNINIVYPKHHAIPKKTSELSERINKWLNTSLKRFPTELSRVYNSKKHPDNDKIMKAPYYKTHHSVLDLLNRSAKCDREDRLNTLIGTLDACFPPLEGDIVTYIGSTFWRYGEDAPYLNHCIALDKCGELDNAEIECYPTERHVLLKWRQLIERENPDIIIGYNIFGFDYTYMFQRAKENKCEKEFLKMSRNKHEICGKQKSNEWFLEEKELVIASGTHQLKYINMPGRIQVDLYNYFRREYNLESYKLDFVSGYFIGDKVSSLEIQKDSTKVYSKNLTGLTVGNFIQFEETAHSSELYAGGAKFQVCSIEDNGFTVKGSATPDIDKCKVKWGLAKDDISPQDIFRMGNGTLEERALIAKYCIQDCNLVHHLLQKVDIVTSIVEMSNICSVPLDFIIMRGQGIKLFSFVAKQCRERNTLIPTIEKKNDGSYEGAIVLPPKTGLYLDEPVACVDYSSLYPSSMISENISHDSKVWTKEYDLEGNLIREEGNPKYDNLEGYKYVDVEYDTYDYIANHRGKLEKTLTGKKVCRFAQFPNGEKAIMPEILSDLLKARKSTRASAKWKTVKTTNNEYTGMIVEQTEEEVKIKDKKGIIQTIQMENVDRIEDTFNDFMKNVLDKRQLAIKVTANSLYGQCGARTSSFYEKDIAASTTATGRKLLTYARRIIEEVYGDRICETKYGVVHSHAEYIYGDSVLGDTPIILKHKDTGEINVKRIMDLSNEWKSYEEFKPHDTISSNRKEKQQSTVQDYKVWTKNGWSEINRVIRHKCNKKIYRVVTHNSVVDVTEDHSLLDVDGNKIKPNECNIGTELLENRLFDSPKMSLNFQEIEDYINQAMSVEEKKAFIHGYYSVDGEQCTMEEATMIRFDCKNKLTASSLQLLVSSLGYNVSIDADEKDVYRITCTANKLRKQTNIIKKLFVKHETYNDFVYDIETADGTFNTGFPLIIKNTDSVFMSFKLTDPETKQKIRGKDALKITIELAKEAGELATKFLKAPHDLEYEKTFMPFCLLSKKRYVGMLYEEDPDKCYRKSMGIVLKRRDNAPIVKDVYGGIIDILMKEQNINQAVKFTRKCLNDMVSEKYPLEKLVITKSLRGFYKNPAQIAHKVLADRIAKRDPGNKPSPGDRIPFVYIQKKKWKLQGDKIEHPEYIRNHKLKPDYSHYITNQIMKPVLQLFALVMEEIPGYQREVKRSYETKVHQLEKTLPDDKFVEKRQQLREKIVKQLVFDDSLRVSDNSKKGNNVITSFFKKQ